MTLTDTRHSAGHAGGGELAEIELRMLLQGLLLRYGYDFTNYQYDTLLTRVEDFRQLVGGESTLRLAERMLRDETLFFEFLPQLSVSVTSFFRDTAVFRSLKENVFPMLRTWPRFKIWHAGCATGEEVFSLAILLEEAGLLDRATIFATDISSPALRTAQRGVYALPMVRRGSESFTAAGGDGSFAEYFTTSTHTAIVRRDIRNAVTFSRHNLAMDSSFGEMQLVLCRNVLIYFNDTLRERALDLLKNSTDFGGFLCLGNTESLCFSEVEQAFEELGAGSRIYKRVHQPEQPRRPVFL